VLALWAGAGGLELKLQFRTALNDVAQQKPEEWESFNGSGLKQRKENLEVILGVTSARR
jgi:hypothetical protein